MYITPIAVLSLLVGQVPDPPTVPGYTVGELKPTGDQPDSVVGDIDDAGNVVGYFYWGGVDTASDFQAFLYDGDRIQNLPGLGLPETFAHAIGDDGAIIGSAAIDELSNSWWFGFDTHAVMWIDGRPTDLNDSIHPPDGTTLTSADHINSHGAMIGSADVYEPINDSTYSYPYFLSAPPARDLHVIGLHHDDPELCLNDLNDAGQVAGSQWVQSTFRAIVWQEGVVANLGTLPPFLDSSANAINNHGQVVGHAYSTSSFIFDTGTACCSWFYRAVLWENGRMTDLGTLGGSESSAEAVNDLGHIVGWAATDEPYSSHAVLWRNGRVFDLNERVSPDLGVFLTEAVAINNVGQIVAQGQGEDWGNRAYLLTPIPADADGDSIDDAVDNCPDAANPDQADSDRDGIGDACDNCPGIANLLQDNSDSDPSGNACDEDDDNDGALDAADNCPVHANADQADSDGDDVGDACDACPGANDHEDADADGFPDGCDNCPHDENFSQEDLDGDGIGDLCDADADGDGVGAEDNCLATPNASQEDSDGDGEGDECDYSYDPPSDDPPDLIICGRGITLWPVLLWMSWISINRTRSRRSRCLKSLASAPSATISAISPCPIHAGVSTVMFVLGLWFLPALPGCVTTCDLSAWYHVTGTLIDAETGEPFDPAMVSVRLLRDGEALPDFSDHDQESQSDGSFEDILTQEIEADAACRVPFPGPEHLSLGEPPNEAEITIRRPTGDVTMTVPIDASMIDVFLHPLGWTVGTITLGTVEAPAS